MRASSWWLIAWEVITRLVFFMIFTTLLAELRRALERERFLARTDFLTKSLNRRAFYLSANHEIQRAQRYLRPLTLAYIDLDGFKKANDRLGHNVGDLILIQVAQVITNNVRAIDIVARLGGDEFVLLLPETNLAGSERVLPRLQQHLLAAMQAQNWPVTFSIGAITYQAPPPTLDEMVKLADELMYEVKNSGKNAIKYAVCEPSQLLTAD
jgi:diguanylate cyclase (GGDEF)-like protein